MASKTQNEAKPPATASGTVAEMNIGDLEVFSDTVYSKALKLASEHADNIVDPLVEKKLIRKIDLVLMPIMCFTYALQYYDKSVLSQAAIFGMKADLGLDEGLRYSNTSLIFYCGFIVGAYPATLLAQRFPTAKVCSVICFIWACVVLCTPACRTYSGFMANRFFLGLIESGVSPSFMLVTSMWYTNSEQILRASFWYSCSGGINIITPLINYGLGHITGGALASWQYMYLVAGVVTIFWSITLWFIFPDSPTTAKGFTEDERALILLRLRSNNTGVENPRLSSKQTWETFTSFQFWAVFILSMLTTTASGATSTFASIVFNDMGFTTFTSLLLNLPLGALAFITILGSGYLGRIIPNSRHHIVSIACVPVIVGCCLLWQLSNDQRAGRIIGFYLVTFFGSSWTQCIAFGTSNFAGYTKKTVVAAGIFVAYCLGNIIGPLLFNSKYAPRYDQSFIGLLICFSIALVLVEITRFFLARENKKRDAAFGSPGESQGLFDLTEKENEDFRYQL